MLLAKVSASEASLGPLAELVSVLAVSEISSALSLATGSALSNEVKEAEFRAVDTGREAVTSVGGRVVS